MSPAPNLPAAGAATLPFPGAAGAGTADAPAPMAPTMVPGSTPVAAGGTASAGTMPGGAPPAMLADQGQTGAGAGGGGDGRGSGPAAAPAPLGRAESPALPPLVENALFSVKTFAASLLALVISYWMELQAPQWAFITAYLVSQPLVGAMWAKGAFRIVGSVTGGVFAILCVALFAQAGPFFIAAMALWLGACAFSATLARNFTSYGFALAGYTAPMIGFESMSMPDHGWVLAYERVTEVVLGIVCVGLVHALVLPRYAGDALARGMSDTFSGLAGYAAIVLRPGTPDADFTARRHRMAGNVLKFDALRSYALFENPDLRRQDSSMSRVVRSFMGLLSVARGLHVRLEELRREEEPKLAALLDPALDRVAALMERVSAEPDGPHSDAAAASLDEARAVLAETRRRLEALAEAEAPEHVAHGLLVLQRTGDMIDSLARSILVAAGRLPLDPDGTLVAAALQHDARTALVQALRAATALVFVGVYWIFSAWTAAVPAMTGLTIAIVMFVTAPNQAKQATNFLVGCGAAMVVAFFVRAYAVPLVGDFVPFAALLAIVLLPAGMVMPNPTYGFVATVFAAFYASNLGLTNVPVFDTATYIDSSIGMLLGLAAGVLAIELILPFDHAGTRRRQWREAVEALPPAARGTRSELAARRPILIALLKLMPRLDLARRSDDEIMAGSFGLASMSLELVRLRRRAEADPFPPRARAAVVGCLETLARCFEALARDAGGGDPEDDPARRFALIDEAAAAVAATRGELAAHPCRVDDAPTIEVLHALASLRFIADRLGFDRAFLAQDAQGMGA